MVGAVPIEMWLKFLEKEVDYATLKTIERYEKLVKKWLK
jgi:hypothetical protein